MDLIRLLWKGPGELTTMYNILHLRKCIPKCKQMLTKLLEYNSFESDRLEKGMISSSQLRLPIRTIGGLLNSYYYQGTTPRDSNLIGLG